MTDKPSVAAAPLDLDSAPANPSSAKPTVVEALAAVAEQVRSVPKGDRNTQQGYSFRGIDAVVNAVGPAFREHGVVCVPLAQDITFDTYSTKGGTAMRNCVVTVQYRFYGPAGDSLDCVVMGESSDAGDKATPKAFSVAYRTALLQALTLPTDERDPDADSHERALPPATADEQQLMEIEAWIHTATPDQQAELKAWWKTQRIPKLERLTADQAERVLRHARALELVPSGANTETPAEVDA